jgi:response regulator RpfG family c-di-GMP phosphodiesterase
MLKQVVIIDDHDGDLLFGRMMVERSRVAARVRAFETAQDALAYLQRPEARDVDLILLDINMPVMNGYEFLAAFEAVRDATAPQAAVVMLTSSPDPADRQRAVEFPSVRDYLIKPVNPSHIQQVVQRIFGPAAAAGSEPP